MKPKVTRNMVEISKNDKKIWENYVSNFKKYAFFPRSDTIINTERYNKKTYLKNNKSSNRNIKFKKKMLEPDMFLDLHGHTLYSSKLLLNKFIFNCYEKNIRDILIITGKGQNNKGALKEEVPKWLSDKFINKFIVNFSVAPKHFGGEGALLVRIRNKLKKSN